MTKDPQNLIDEAQRDIAAAKAELRGRAEQTAADYEERIAQLVNISASLESGELSPRVAADRVRQLLGERGGIAGMSRAGRTHVGMRAPGAPAATPAVGPRAGPTPTLASAALVKAETEVDSRVVGVLVGHGIRREEARLELALLAHLRRGLDLVAADVPCDAVLIEGVMEFADEVLAVVSDLDTDGPPRLRRLLDYLRELAGQLVAVGAAVGDMKEQIRRTQTLLDAATPDVKKVTDDTVALFMRLAPESDRRLPAKDRTLFDDLLRA